MEKVHIDEELRLLNKDLKIILEEIEHGDITKTGNPHNSELEQYFKKLHSLTQEQDRINLIIRKTINDSTDPRWIPIHMIDAANAIILEIASGEGHIGNPEYVREKINKLNSYSFQLR